MGTGSEEDTVEIPELTRRNEDFRAVYCKRFNCRPEKFEKRFFWEVLEPDIKPLAYIFWLIPNYFRKDFETIRRIAAVRNKTEAFGIANRLSFDPKFNRGFFRGFMRIRISDELLRRMANRVF